MKSFVTVLFVVYELYLCESQEISAGTPVFVLKGDNLLLNNLQEADSGVYTAEVTKEEVAKYNVKVQDRVSPVNLTVVHQSSGSIICNHRNHVSWTNDTITIKDVCHQRVYSQPPIPVLAILGVFFSILILAIIGVVLWCRRKRRTSNRVILENTVYSSALPGAPARTQDPTDDEDSALRLSSCYACVGPHTGPPAPTETRNTAQLESVYAEVKKTTRGP
ncbi:hypothetical protein JOQ06_001180 [Pogonophryne albipinna]|uniref:Uncharacterized protein n=1 Tax=Pogonophryne albipinna TaxID=1090488 RepID=A0AAD6B5D3_9TELE|nr:hypothetical protein JOQ06_001180 [Pogonophryne albipinna]